MCITGASGSIYGVEVLRHLRGERVLIISDHGKEVLRHETPYTPEQLAEFADVMYENTQMDADIASGSCLFDAVVVVPCSMNTLSKISYGVADNLITRVASIALKEGRKLVLVVRETPLSTVHLEAMHRVALAGATVLPAMPAFYHHPKSVEDLVKFVVGRILDVLGVEHTLYHRWRTNPKSA